MRDADAEGGRELGKVRFGGVLHGAFLTPGAEFLIVAGHRPGNAHINRIVLRKKGGDSAGLVGEVFGFVGGEGAVEEGLLAVAEPLFQDLVAAEGGEESRVRSEQ